MREPDRPASPPWHERATNLPATNVTAHRGRTLVFQVGAPAVKDCLVAWAGKVSVEGMTR